MNMRRFAVAASLAGMMLAVMPLAARPANAEGQIPDPQQGIGAASAVTLKVTVTISKWDGEKKLSSSPYILMVVPSYGKRATEGQDGDYTSVQMGSETPVPQPTIGQGDGKVISSYSYRTLGTNINVAGRPVDDGKFNLSVSVQDSQLAGMQAVAGPGSAPSVPRFQTFKSTNRLTMRDGQTTKYAVATDTITGQVTKLDVTMNVVK